jgi:hypothetical protein
MSGRIRSCASCFAWWMRIAPVRTVLNPSHVFQQLRTLCSFLSFSAFSDSQHVTAVAIGTITADEFVGWMGDAPTDDAATRKRSAVAAKKVHKKDAVKLGGDILRLKRNFRAAAYHDGKMDMAALFGFYDRDNSGTIGLEEFRQAARKHGKVTAKMVSDDELGRLFAQVRA